MKVILDIENNKAPLFMELVKSLDYITSVREVKEEKGIDSANVKQYYWGELYYFDHEILTCFNSLKKSLNFHEARFEIKILELNKLIEQCSNRSLTGYEEAKSLYDIQFYEIEKIECHIMKYLQRNAIVNSAFAILESKLIKLIENLKDFLNLACGLDGKKKYKSDLDRIRKYLIHVVGISASNSVLFLKQVENDKIIRNVLSHNNGIVQDENIKRLKIPDGISFSVCNEVKIKSPEYLFLLIDKMQKFINELFIEVDLRIPKPEAGQN